MKTEKRAQTRKLGITSRRARDFSCASKVSEETEAIRLTASPFKVKSILVPIDFSKPSKKALLYAVPLAEQFGAKITLLHVVEPLATADLVYFPVPMEYDRVIKAMKVKLDLLAKDAEIDPNLVRTLIRYGSPFREITDAAKGLKVDLIIISTHGYGGLKHALLGSTTERVVRHAACPVLVVREGEHEFVYPGLTAAEDRPCL
jgi:universal stress protein A